MKSNLSIFALTMGLVMLASCSSSDNNEIIDENVKVEKIISVSNNPQTRAYWNNGAIYWNSTDKTKVFVDNHPNGDVFSIVNYQENKDYLQFKGMTYQHGNYYVVYPAAQASTLNGDKVRVTIPATQQAHKDSFDPTACIQIARAANLDQPIQMQHVCAFLKITVTAPCEYVEVEPNTAGYGIVGTVDADYEGKIDADNGWITRVHTVRLENLTENGTYLIVIGPSEGYANGLTARVKYPDCDVITKTTNKNLQISRGYVYEMGTCNKPVNNNSDANIDGPDPIPGGSNEPEFDDEED